MWPTALTPVSRVAELREVLGDRSEERHSGAIRESLDDVHRRQGKSQGQMEPSCYVLRTSTTCTALQIEVVKLLVMVI